MIWYWQKGQTYTDLCKKSEYNYTLPPLWLNDFQQRCKVSSIQFYVFSKDGAGTSDIHWQKTESETLSTLCFKNHSKYKLVQPLWRTEWRVL